MPKLSSHIPSVSVGRRSLAAAVFMWCFAPAALAQSEAIARSLESPRDTLYFVRTLSLVIGERYEYARYFLKEGNPIVLQVLRAERVTVPAGTFDAIVIQPLIRTRGIFSDRGRAEVWLRTDGAHEVLQVKSHLAFGSRCHPELRNRTIDAARTRWRRSQFIPPKPPS